MTVQPAALAAIASPRRREILRLLWEQERSAGQINQSLPDVTFGAVSTHLGALTRAGLVSVRQEGRHRIYRVRREALGPLGKVLEQMWADALWHLKVRAEFDATRRGPKPSEAPPQTAEKSTVGSTSLVAVSSYRAPRGEKT